MKYPWIRKLFGKRPKKWKERTEKIGRKSRENEKNELSYSAKVSKNLTFFVEKIIFRKKVMVAFGGFNNFAYRFICSKRVRPLFCIIRYDGTMNV